MQELKLPEYLSLRYVSSFYRVCVGCGKLVTITTDLASITQEKEWLKVMSTQYKYTFVDCTMIDLVDVSFEDFIKDKELQTLHTRVTDTCYDCYIVDCLLPQIDGPLHAARKIAEVFVSYCKEKGFLKEGSDGIL